MKDGVIDRDVCTATLKEYKEKNDRAGENWCEQVNNAMIWGYISVNQVLAERIEISIYCLMSACVNRARREDEW